MKRIISSESIPFIIIGAVTVLIVGLGVMLISSDSTPDISEEDKNKIIVRSDSHSTGKEDSKIVLVDFSDYQCPHCAEFAPIQKQLRDEFGDQVRFVSRSYAINFSNPAIFKSGIVGSDAVEAAAAQGKFWEMHDILFENQNAWVNLEGDERYEKLVSYAKEAGVADLEKFEKELREEKYRSKVLRDYNDGVKLGVTGTPTIFLNGEQVSDRSYEGLKSQLQTLLSEETEK